MQDLIVFPLAGIVFCKSGLSFAIGAVCERRHEFLCLS